MLIFMADVLIIFFAVVPVYVAILFAVVRVLTLHEKKHHGKHIISVLISGLLGLWLSQLFKVMLAHPRPDVLGALFTPGDLYSFPSGHATVMFALAFSLYGFDKNGGKILLVLAILTGIARVLAGVHFWYDILGGVCIGAGVASLVYFVLRTIRKG
jgi:undecaprenyl-diphosphatase